LLLDSRMFDSSHEVFFVDVIQACAWLHPSG
jgi:hypothetical protein